MTGLAADVAAAGRSHAGRTARATGEAFELALDRYHRTLEAQGRAYVRRVGAPIAVLGRVSRDARGRHIFRAAWDGFQGVDFTGHTQTGVHIAIEAKTHAGLGAWDCGIDPTGDASENGAIQARQWVELRRVELCGGIAFIILRAWGREWAIPPHMLALHGSTKGRRTVRPDEIDAIGFRGLEWMR
jgi:hypothetical protein